MGHTLRGESIWVKFEREGNPNFNVVVVRAVEEQV
jgi:hypothetical protein